MLVLVFTACNKENLLQEEFTFNTPAGFPEMDVPSDNTLTESRWLLGKKLFYDPILSRDSSISCASCHLAQQAFSDVTATSLGVDGLSGTRNSPTLANVGYHPYFTREGGVPTLEMQVLVPIQEHAEMDFNIVAASERMLLKEAYIDLSQEAYGRAPDFYVITRALACFERTLVSGNSAYDQFQYQGKTTALNQTEKNGMSLFFSNRTNCSNCHGGFNFTTYAFENNGLYENYEDQGRFRLTNDLADAEKFKIPTLRNIALTAPYMHDGSMNTLEEVVSHYNLGGLNNPHKSPLLQALNLSEIEQQELIAFLKALSDYEFVNNTKYR